MDWTVVLVAAAGVAGTVLAPVVTARQGQRSWLRQRRVELYSDALVHAEAAERLRWRLMARDDVEPYDVGGPAEAVSADLIGARMRLYGEAEVREAWQAFRGAWARLRAQVWLDYGGGPQPPLVPDDPGVRALRAAVEELSEVCRRQVVGR